MNLSTAGLVSDVKLNGYISEGIIMSRHLLQLINLTSNLKCNY